MKLKLIKLNSLCGFCLLLMLLGCKAPQENSFDIPLNEFTTENREYLFFVYFSGADCMSCLHHLEQLRNIQSRIDQNGSNTLVVVVGDSSKGFMEVINYFKVSVPVINVSKINRYDFFRENLTPTVYFINLRTGHVVFMDKLPEEEYRFNALRDLVYAWSGVLSVPGKGALR